MVSIKGSFYHLANFLVVQGIPRAVDKLLQRNIKSLVVDEAGSPLTFNCFAYNLK